MNVVCTPGYKVNIYYGLNTTATITERCVTSPITLSVPLTSLSDGFYHFAATVTDLASNESERSLTILLQKNPLADTSAPGVPDMDALSDFGSSSIDNLTRETRPILTATCMLGSTVDFYDGTALIGTSPCMAGVAQMVPAVPLSAGPHSISAKQKNTA